MSMDRSLKSASSLVRHRNVLTRAERITQLSGEEKWTEQKNSVYGLPKVGHRKLNLAKPAKEEAAEGATPAAGAPAAAPAAGAKAAAPAAAGAKGAAAAPAAGAKAAPAAKKK